MKRTRCTQEQIAFALRQAEGGTAVEEICRRMGVSEATPLTGGGRGTPAWAWPRSDGGPQLEEENGKLKKLVADLSLDREMLQDALRKRRRGPSGAGRSCGTSRSPTRSRSVAAAG